MKSINLGNCIISFADTTGSVRVKNRIYRFEFDDYLGPIFLKKNGDPLENQPLENHPVWPGFYKWLKRYEEKKEEFDGKVKDWNEASAQFKEATNKLESIERQLAAENDKIAQGGTPNARLIAELTRQKGDYEIERNAAVREQGPLEGDITRLGGEISNLRHTINAERSAYRRNVQKAAQPNIVNVVFDKAALRSAALSLTKTTEPGFKPKNLNDALSKGLRARITLPNP
jgi:hypothetical protein